MTIPEYPITREEMYLDAIARGSGSGGGGDITLETLNVSANGTTNAPSGKAYNKVVANVPNTYAASDEGKVVSGGTLVSQTAHATVTENGTIDTTLNNSVVVDVPTGGGGGGDVASGTSVATNKTMVIPKVAGKSNFFAYVDGDSAYITKGAALAAFRLSWLIETAVYSTKIINPLTTPPQIQSVTHNAAFVTETEDSISIKFPNENTVGLLPDGTTVRYMWW